MNLSSDRYDDTLTADYNFPRTAGRAIRAAKAKGTKSLPTEGRGHPTTSEMDYTVAEQEFMMAVDSWKTKTGRKFPTLCEILRIAREMGYTRDVEPVDLQATMEFDTSIVAAQAQVTIEDDKTKKAAERPWRITSRLSSGRGGRPAS